MYSEFSEEKLRSICREYIETFEKWARIIVDMELTRKYGIDYIHTKNSDGNFLIKKEIVKKADKMRQDEPTRFPKPVDIFFFEDIIYLLCRQDLYQDCFSSFLSKMYPDGDNEVRTFLERLIPIRNKLSHTNPFSRREVEQCVCYCIDYIESKKNILTK